MVNKRSNNNNLKSKCRILIFFTGSCWRRVFRRSPSIAGPDPLRDMHVLAKRIACSFISCRLNRAKLLSHSSLHWSSNKLLQPNQFMIKHQLRHCNYCYRLFPVPNRDSDVLFQSTRLIVSKFSRRFR